MRLTEVFEKIVLGIFLSFMLTTGAYFAKDAFVQKVFALRPTDTPEWKFTCLTCDDPCPVKDGLCEKIEIFG